MRSEKNTTAEIERRRNATGCGELRIRMADKNRFSKPRTVDALHERTTVRFEKLKYTQEANYRG